MTSSIPLTDEFHEDGGIGFRVRLPTKALELLASDAHRTLAFITEDDVPLPGVNMLHDDIRRTPGCFSIWGEEVYCSASDGSDPRTNKRSYAVVIPDPASVVPAPGTYPLSRPFGSVGGLAASSAIPEPAKLLMDQDGLVRACSIVLEDGVPLPDPDSHHEDIREFGAGRFSIWGDQVIFSASDGSDCSRNGRVYELHVPDDPQILAGTLSAFERRAAGDDEFILRMLAASANTNNTIANNFLACEAPLAYFAKHGITGGRAVVLGCGSKPWAPLRFLAAGFDEVVANDLLPVANDFSAKAIEYLLTLLVRLAPDETRRLEDRVEDRGARVGFHGLVCAGGIPFEALDLAADSVDAVFSTSVLEHVMDPVGVYEAMSRIIRPGGGAFHVIDLRDHLHFSDPLRFLRLSDEEYAAINTENRLRASDHIRLARDAGFHVAIDHVVALATGAPATASHSEPPVVRCDSLDSIIPALSQGDVTGLAHRFQTYDTRDLSTVGITIALHSPTR